MIFWEPSTQDKHYHRLPDELTLLSAEVQTLQQNPSLGTASAADPRCHTNTIRSSLALSPNTAAAPLEQHGFGSASTFDQASEEQQAQPEPRSLHVTLFGFHKSCLTDCTKHCHYRERANDCFTSEVCKALMWWTELSRNQVSCYIRDELLMQTQEIVKHISVLTTISAFNLGLAYQLWQMWLYSVGSFNRQLGAKTDSYYYIFTSYNKGTHMH